MNRNHTLIARSRSRLRLASVAHVLFVTLVAGLRVGAQERTVEVLTNDAVVRMVNGKIPRGVIIAKIEATKNNFDITAAGLVGLYKSKVPNDVARTNTATQGLITATLRTTVILSTVLTNAQLAALRTQWGNRQFDAVRVTLSAMTIEKGVNDGNGRKLAEKFGCFFAYADQSGLLK